jgi:hypothetical protein
LTGLVKKQYIKTRNVNVTLVIVLQAQEPNKFDAAHRKRSELLSTAEFVKI